MSTTQEIITGKKILVVDDDLITVASLKKILRNIQCRVMAAQNAFEGWHMIQVHKPDIVIIDILMPLVNGVTLFEQIRNTPDTSHIPCLFFTATATQEIACKISELGGGYLLVKPIVPEVLIEKLTEALRSNVPMKPTEMALSDYFINCIVSSDDS